MPATVICRGRTPRLVHPEDRLDGRHAPSPVRAAGVSREAGRHTPRPRINLVLYHGVLAPHAAWRARVVAYGAAPVEVPVPASPAASTSDDATEPGKPRHWAWADLMRRVFDIDVLACPRCGGRMRLIATIDDATE